MYSLHIMYINNDDLLRSHRELRDFRQRFDTLTHEIKRKEMQIKELQARVDTGDGCKYISIDNITKKSFVRTLYLRIYKNLVSTIIIQTAAIHAMYVICKSFNLSQIMFRR